jgi:caa(3)-type oxidase subunit IV
MSDSHQHGSPAKTAEAHDVGHDAAHFHDHSKLYLVIGAVLMGCTAVTVWFSYINFGSEELNILFGMLLAAFKASLVALIFMHLKEEKMTIYQFMLVTMVFVTGLFLLTLLAFKDHIHL